MDEPLGLEGLHDIVLPPTPPLWPPGDGFWVALLLLALVLVVGWRWRRQWQRRNAYRVAGLGLLAQARTVYEVSVVLKRVALAAWPREQVAPLQGPDWVHFLNGSCRRCRFADDDLAQPGAAIGRALRDHAERWIRGHRVQDAGGTGRQ
jgi:uncharacterized SAM-binding protein YcdF (DUF218 family)